ncbi:30S ribosomal protein S12 methylthiotransferase accessory factor YcaO [Thiomicrorhabdus aquaedulcis]|uniref:30S ribosomal protein S12 methylthiotransferase accessory factor YcaO n=1 Tax=Thiomicrorhabdus aquaedulcis TaxID=2211106 RepID=UPI000FD9827C|nr:30S ribosomal protein S12 methylthiotransferase accessory factor YcaO [Thiomicrorhabdus aquaedulcis]
MSELTFIKGKDACLEISIANMHRILKDAGFQIVEASWLNPVPNIHSVHIYDARCPGLFTNGKGTSAKSTLASALGEYLERLSTNYFFSDYWLENPSKPSSFSWLYYPNEKSFTPSQIESCLTPKLWRFYDDNNGLQANELLSFNDSQANIRAVAMQGVFSGDTVYFPMNLFSNLYASNGLSAGNNALEARVQGLSEVFERWVKNKILRENLCLPVVPEAVVQNYPAVVEAMAALQEEGISLSIRDASLGGQFPVINVTLFEQKTGRCFASFGAHPLFEVALERTLTESLQGRKLGDLDGFQVPVFDAFAVAEDENIENHFIDSSGLIHAHFVSNDFDFEFTPWDFAGTTEEQWQALCAMVKAQGAEIYLADYNHYDFAACRLVVPGMSEIYPRTELLDSNQNTGREVREALLNLPHSQDYSGLVDLLDDLGLSDHQGVASIIGLMPDPGTFWAQVKVIELKFWCYLASKQSELALESVQDALYFIGESSAFIKRYRALQFCLEMHLEGGEVNYFSTEQLFGKSDSDQAWSNIAGQQLFWGEVVGLDIFETSQRHQALLSIYESTQAVKAASIAV